MSRLAQTSPTFSKADIVFLAPISRINPNALAISPETLVATASVIQRDLDQARPRTRTSSPYVTLADQQILDGARVRVPDTGGQWQHNFSRPVLDVQVTGSSPDAVRAKVESLESLVNTQLGELQDASKVRPVNRITLRMSPSEPTVTALQGSPSRAMFAAFTIGSALTVVACAGADQLRSRRRRT